MFAVLAELLARGTEGFFFVSLTFCAAAHVSQHARGGGEQCRARWSGRGGIGVR